MKALVAVLGVALVAGAASATWGAPSRPPPARPAVAPPPPPAAMGVAARKPIQGYLAPGRIPDVVHLIGPPPPEGSGTKTGDVATYENTRLMQGGERWALAAHDAVFGADALMQDFSCALGAELTAARVPALHRLLERMAIDTDAAIDAPKRYYRRPRPFIENGGPICVEPEEWLRRSYSYPSGHSTYSWAAALALAEIAPDRADRVLARARAYAESRVVCGVHYESDIQAGRVSAIAVYAALQADAGFRHDLLHARLELKRLRLRPPPPPPEECRVEALAQAAPVW